MRKLATVIAALMFCAGLSAQIREEFPDEYLDTVKLRVNDVVNDVSTIGISFGGTFTGMNFNPGHSQHRDFYPGYISIMYSRYEKMFDYLPNFGFMIGVEYGHEGYHFKENKETGNTFVYYKERSEAIKMSVIEVPFLGMIHFDTRNTKAYADIGIYGGYRLGIERFGPLVEDEYRYKFYDTDIRWDYGFQGGAGFALVFSPIEISIGAQLRYALSSIFTPDSQFPEGSGYEDRNKYYYRFAYPLDIMVSVGIHFELGRRYGKTRKALKQEAYDIVYGNAEEEQQ